MDHVTLPSNMLICSIVAPFHGRRHVALGATRHFATDSQSLFSCRLACGQRGARTPELPTAHPRLLDKCRWSTHPGMHLPGYVARSMSSSCSPLSSDPVCSPARRRGSSKYCGLPPPCGYSFSGSRPESRGSDCRCGASEPIPSVCARPRQSNDPDASRRERDPRDSRIEQLERENTQLREDLTRTEHDRDRWKRRTGRLQQQLGATSGFPSGGALRQRAAGRVVANVLDGAPVRSTGGRRVAGGRRRSTKSIKHRCRPGVRIAAARSQ